MNDATLDVDKVYYILVYMYLPVSHPVITTPLSFTGNSSLLFHLITL